MNKSLDLEQIFRLPQKELKEALEQRLRELGYQVQNRKGFLYAAGEVPVLLVAHMDTVHREPPEHICYTQKGHVVMSPQGIGGDDRAGVYMILEIIREIHCHVLFSEDEEIGCVGASMFVQSNIFPAVNYIVELDRQGSEDAVFYDCCNEEFENFVCSFGFDKALGSMSDISYIAPHLGTAAVNISAGYYYPHTRHEYIRLDLVKRNIRRLCQMVGSATEHFEYREAPVDYMSEGQYMMCDWDWEHDRAAATRTRKMCFLPPKSKVEFQGAEVPKLDKILMDRLGRVYMYYPKVDAVIELLGASATTLDGREIKYQKAEEVLMTLMLASEVRARLGRAG